MSAIGCGLLGAVPDEDREYALSDYEGARARW